MKMKKAAQLALTSAVLAGKPAYQAAFGLLGPLPTYVVRRPATDPEMSTGFGVVLTRVQRRGRTQGQSYIGP